MAGKGEFSALEPDYGTPDNYAESCRVVFGGVIDLDPCTSELFNTVIRAKKIFTRENNALAPGRIWLGNAIVNAPGEGHGSLVKRFWEKLIEQYRLGNITAAIWIGFNINQLQTLQRARVDAHPLHFPMCVPTGRMEFSTTSKDHQVQLFGEPERELIPATDPGHPNFIALLPDRTKSWQVDLFYREFSKYGAVKI